MGRGINWWDLFWKGVFRASDDSATETGDYVFCTRESADLGDDTEALSSFAAWQSTVSNLALTSNMDVGLRH